MTDYIITPRNNKIGGILADLFAGMTYLEYDTSVVINQGLAKPVSTDIFAHFKNTNFKPYIDIVFKDNRSVVDVDFNIVTTKYNKAGDAIIRTHLLGVRPMNIDFNEETGEGTICFTFGYTKTEYLL
jgi:hypothetical protein